MTTNQTDAEAWQSLPSKDASKEISGANSLSLSREAFEAWLRERAPKYTLNRIGPSYIEGVPETLWNGWQGCIAYAESQRAKQAEQGGDLVEETMWKHLSDFVESKSVKELSTAVTKKAYANGARELSIAGLVKFCVEEIFWMAENAKPNNQHPTSSKSAALLKEAISRELHEEKSGFWRTCTGCYEGVDGQNVYDFPESDLFGCIIGHGCSECGGIGATWDNIDYEAAYRESLSEHPTEQARGIAALGEDDLAYLLFCSSPSGAYLDVTHRKDAWNNSDKKQFRDQARHLIAAGVINVKGEG